MAHAITHSLGCSSERQETESSTSEGHDLVVVNNEDVVWSSEQVGEFQNGGLVNAEKISGINMELIVAENPSPSHPDNLKSLEKQATLHEKQFEVKSEPVTTPSGDDANEQVGELQNLFYLVDAPRRPELRKVKDEPVLIPSGEQDDQIAELQNDSLTDAARIPEARIQLIGVKDECLVIANVDESVCPMNPTEPADTGDATGRTTLQHRETLQPAKRRQPVLAGDGSLQCKQCGKNFSSRRDLQRHVMYHNGEKPHRCQHCDKCFTQKVSLQQHIRCHTGERPYKCQHCDKCFAQNSHLQQHILCHTGEKPHKCVHCGRCFSQRASLQHHILCHTGEKPHKCQHCDKSFAQIASLRQHVLCHSGERPHECLHCKKCFATTQHLKQHMLFHTGEKSHKCQFCDKSFARNGHLQEHILCHTGEKPHQCQYCGKCFAQNTGLQRHIRCHTGEKPYRCEHCNKGFARRATLQKHIQSHIADEKSVDRKAAIDL